MTTTAILWIIAIAAFFILAILYIIVNRKRFQPVWGIFAGLLITAAMVF